MNKNRFRFKHKVITKISLNKAAIIFSVASVFSAVLIILFQTGPKQEAVAGSGSATVPAGSFIINMGITPQTFANGLKPYGMIYDLMMNYNVPVIWSINPSKAKDGNDFVYNNIDYKGGPFIISAPYISADVASRITYWQGQGVQGLYTTSQTVIPVYDTLTTFPLLIIDSLSGNQGIIMTYFSNASIPSSAYSIGKPASLTACHDMWVNPHGDPVWATHSYLFNFVTVQKSYIWSQCHAVSMMEGCFNPFVPSQQLNYLTSNGLKCWKSSGCGALITETHAKSATTPFTHFYHSEPVMQFMGSMAGATTDGSEQWYQPVSAGTGWRTTSKRGVTTATGTSPKEGTVLVYGPAYGNPANGWVMYEGGHNLNESGTIPEKVAAQRAFFNFCLLAGKAKTVFFTSYNIPTSFQASQALPVSVNVTSGTPSYTYQWTSSVPGGYFGNPNAASTFYMTPPVMSTTYGVLTCLVVDQCGRRNFVSVPIVINPSPLPVMLLYFKHEVNSKNEVILTWSTASEKNNDYFTVERSTSQSNFKEIGRVKGSGTTSQSNVYSFVDKQPLNGISYYRLKQTDFNGSYEVFAAIEVKVKRNESASRISIYPNPFSESFTASFEAEQSGIYQLQILALDGRLLKNYQMEATEGNNQINIENLNLQPGKYIVRALGEEKALGSTVVVCRK
jgi:hypothetical protein